MYTPITFNEVYEFRKDRPHLKPNKQEFIDYYKSKSWIHLVRLIRLYTGRDLVSAKDLVFEYKDKNDLDQFLHEIAPIFGTVATAKTLHAIKNIFENWEILGFKSFKEAVLVILNNFE